MIEPTGIWRHRGGRRVQLHPRDKLKEVQHVWGTILERRQGKRREKHYGYDMMISEGDLLRDWYQEAPN